MGPEEGSYLKHFPLFKESVYFWLDSPPERVCSSVAIKLPEIFKYVLITHAVNDAHGSQG